MAGLGDVMVPKTVRSPGMITLRWGCLVTTVVLLYIIDLLWCLRHKNNSLVGRFVPLFRGMSGDGTTAAMVAGEPPFWCCLAGDDREPSSSCWCCIGSGGCGVVSVQTGSLAVAAALVAPGLSDMSRAHPTHHDHYDDGE